MQIVHLRDRPDLAPMVARWIWDEWRDLLVQPTLEDFARWFRGTKRGSRLPTTLILLLEELPVGTVSLECADMEIRPDLSPWLASLYVREDHRGQGLGKRLVRAAEQEARWQEIGELFLYTPAHEGFYAALGWQLVEKTIYRDRLVSVMARQLGGRR